MATAHLRSLQPVHLRFLLKRAMSCTADLLRARFSCQEVLAVTKGPPIKAYLLPSTDAHQGTPSSKSSLFEYPSPEYPNQRDEFSIMEDSFDVEIQMLTPESTVQDWLPEPYANARSQG
ncbi:hypothetical protein ANCCEY_10260 [Ancylostoma ceylanicum]|uniref:Uncharacterized protein n=1 Tax=Ancylostoma ceylanicum TaxID=53326 RepID=A0A0D6LKW0_9BILA|nr:hypothetical protein ANCCEY_10260 [Ancylostoma ceylanicum]